MSEQYDTMMNPQLEDLIARTGSKFALCTLAAKRAREINSYYSGLGGAEGQKVPPQVTSVARKSLSIAFEEIAAEKIVPMLPQDMPNHDDESNSDDAA